MNEKHNLQTVKTAYRKASFSHTFLHLGIELDMFEAELRDPLTKEQQNEILRKVFKPEYPMTQVFPMASLITGFWQGYTFARKEILGEDEDKEL